MSDPQFNQYNNVVTFATEWRKYKLASKPLQKEQFRNEMQTEQYVRLDCLDTQNNKEVLIYLFDKFSKYVKSSQDLKALLNKIKKTATIILISYKPFNTYGKKAIKTFKHLNIMTYRHEIFDLIVPKCALGYPHRIIGREEIIQLTNEDLCCYLTNLPKIFEEDPQCIWLGAKTGDVIEIISTSDISGRHAVYRVVVPKSGRIIAFAENVTNEEKKAEPDAEASDEEIAEYREGNKADDHDEADDAEETEDLENQATELHDIDEHDETE